MERLHSAMHLNKVSYSDVSNRHVRHLSVLVLTVGVVTGCLNFRAVPSDDAGVATTRPDSIEPSGSGGDHGPGGQVDAPVVSAATDGPAPNFTCVSGSACVLADNPCLVGSTVCADGTATCTPTQRPQANGSVCGAAAVCLDGACKACAAGTSCALDGKPCRAGAIDCSTGQPQCLEVGNANNGITCGPGMVCKEGACSSCGAGDPCVPADPCHEGTLDCTAAAPTCKDTGRPVAAGLSCGSGKVCAADGTCTACVAGASCDLPDGCKTGKIDCGGGTPTCVAAGSAANGKDCGGGKVCSDGACVACKAGSTCTPTNKCHVGTLSCATGTPDCTDTGAAVGNGTPCGNKMFCNNGNCVACTPDATCSLDNPCKMGKTSCATGASECIEGGNAPNGKVCGAGMVCSNGACTACTAGMMCEPSVCKIGAIVCSTGAAQCKESGNASDGTTCGSNRICKNGGCVDACVPGGGCTTGIQSCHKGKYVCANGVQKCMDDGPGNEGQNCGGGKVCKQGNCSCPTGGNFCSAGSGPRCSGTSGVQKCEQKNGCGEWGGVTPCPQGQSCKNGQCGCPADSCAPGEKRCAGTGIETCVKDGVCTKWGDAKSCAPATCLQGECALKCIRPCDEGQKRCQGNAVETCVKDGNCTKWGNPESCAPVACIEGVCALRCIRPCDEGQKRCQGNAVQICVKDGNCTKWGNPESCAPVSCREGECFIKPLP
jgi:hypothetical protein